MNQIELMAPCHFGLEAVLKREIIDLGYEISKVEDGRITFIGDAEAVCRANIGLRTAERVLIKVGEFVATTYDELFEGTKALAWDEYIPKDGKFWVAKAASIKSKLFSPSDIQSIMKKAMVESLKKTYHVERFEESADSYPVRVFIMKDVVTVGLDTTGDSLHKRGYRKLKAKAPIAENLAAALLMLTPWHSDRILVDPFCGSGTFPIEAALMAANIAPGVNREFTSMDWLHLIPASEWKDCFDEARDMENLNIHTDICGYDIDDEMIRVSRANANLAGVGKLVRFEKRGVDELAHSGKYGFIVTNPPYGERIGDKDEMNTLYKTLADRYKALDAWSMYMITAYDDAEKSMCIKSDKNRKIYNGMMQTRFYSFMGPKPPKKN